MRERRLLLDSEVIKDYPEIQKVLVENGSINHKLIGTLPQKQRNFFINVFPFVLNVATSEWKRDNGKGVYEDMGPDENNWKRCSLDNTPNRHIFYIVNRVNGNRLNVGSSCILNFWDGKIEGKPIKKIMEEGRELKLLNILEEKYPGITRTIENWNSYVDGLDVMLPNNLETPYFELGKKVKGLVRDYIKKGDCDLHKLVQEFAVIIREREKHINKIKDYVKKMECNRFAPNENIKNWLRANSSAATREAKNEIKKCGLITWKSAWRIREYNFMKSIVPGLNKALERLDMVIAGIDRFREGYILVSKRQKNIKLFAKHGDLVKDCGWVLFGEDPRPAILEKTIQYCCLYDDNSIYEVVSELNTALKNKGLKFGHPDFDQNDVDIFNSKTNTYILCDLSGVAEKFKGIVIGCKDIQLKDLEKFVANYKGKRYTKGELRETRQIRRDYNIVEK